MIYIFGSNGMLGRYVTKYLSTTHNVTPLTRKDFDIANDSLAKLETILNLNRDSIIVNCAGMIPQRGSENNRDYLRINTVFPLWLSILAAKYGSKVIHITTDCVFSGKKGQYTEEDEHDADYMYGTSKSLAENDSICVIRTSIIGEELENKKSLLEWVRQQDGQTIKGFANHYWNGVTCLQLAKLIKQIIKNHWYWHGVHHVFSPNTVSKYELVKMIVKIYDLNVKIEEHVMENKVDRSLSTIYPNMFEIPELEKQIEEMKEYQL